MKCCPQCGRRAEHNCRHDGESVTTVEIKPSGVVALLRRTIDEAKGELAELHEQLFDAERTEYASTVPYAGYG